MNAPDELEQLRAENAELRRRLGLAMQLRINIAATVEDANEHTQRAQQMEQVYDLLLDRGSLPAADIVKALPILGHELAAEALLQDFVDRGWLDAHKAGCSKPPRLQLGLVRTWLIDLDGREDAP